MLEESGRAVTRSALQLPHWRHPTWPILIGASLILLSLALEHVFHLTGGLSNVISSKLVVLFVAELGIAFVIAFIVSRAVEYQASQKHLDSLNSARREIVSENEKLTAAMAAWRADALKEIIVTQGGSLKETISRIYSATFSDDYVKAALESCFGYKLVREDYNISYRIDSFEKEDCEGLDIDCERFVKVTATIGYKVRNVSSATADLDITYGIPVRPGHLSSYPRAIHMKVGEREYSADELAKMATYDDDSMERDYKIGASIPSGSSLDVAIVAQLVKEISGSDTFGFRYPTTRATLRLDCNVTSPKLQIGAAARIASGMRKAGAAPDGRSLEWRVDGSILPFNSVVFWWRRPEEDTGSAVNRSSADN